MADSTDSDPRQIRLDAGGWLPTMADRLRAYVNRWIASGEVVTEDIAIDDLIVHWDRAERFGERVPGYKTFAQRWRWKEHQARSFWERLGLMAPRYHRRSGDPVGTQGGPSGDPRGTQFTADIIENDSKTQAGDPVGTQWGPSGDPVGTQWGPTPSSISSRARQNTELEEEERESPTDSCAEQSDRSPPTDPPVIKLPLIKDQEFGVSQALVDEYTQAYPAVDVPDQLRRMRAWLISNPKKRKTTAGITRFINTWLGKEQDRGHGAHQQAPGAHTARPQTDYERRRELASTPMREQDYLDLAESLKAEQAERRRSSRGP